MDSTDADLVRAAQAGDGAAFATLFERWLDRVCDVARNIVRNPETATDIAQDTFVGAWKSIGDLRDPAAFGGWILRSARNRALNRLEKEGRARPAGPEELAMIERAVAATRSEADLADAGDPESAVAADESRELVWAASAALGARDASVLDLHLRHGLSAPELAQELGVTPNNAHQLLHRMKRKLGTSIRAWACWRRREDCDQLLVALDAAGCTRFDAVAAKVIDSHAPGCEICSARRDRIADPAALYAAVPILAVPVLLRSKAAAALEAQGVPVDANLVDHGGEPTVVTEPAPTEAIAPVEGATETVSAVEARASARRRTLAAVGVMVVVLLLVAVVALSVGSDDSGPVVGDEPTTTGSPTTATTTSTTAAPTTEAPTTEAPTTTAAPRPTTTARAPVTTPPRDTTTRPDTTTTTTQGRTTTTLTEGTTTNPDP